MLRLVSPLRLLYLFRLRRCLRCLDDEKRLFLLFVSLLIFSVISSPASLRYTEVGFLMGGSRAGNDNYETECKLSARISSGQDQQRPPKWFRVTRFGSIVYLIKKWPIQPQTTCLFLFVAWLPAKASLNRPCVSYCGSRHLSIGSVSPCRVFFRFGWFRFCFCFCFSLSPDPLLLLLEEPVWISLGFYVLIKKTQVQVSVRNMWSEIWLLRQSFALSF